MKWTTKRVIFITGAVVASSFAAALTLLFIPDQFKRVDPLVVLSIKGWLPIVAGLTFLILGKYGGYVFFKGLNDSSDQDRGGKVQLLLGMGLVAFGLVLSGAINAVSDKLIVSSGEIWRAYNDRGGEHNKTVGGVPFFSGDARTQGPELEAENDYKKALSLAESFGESDPRIITSLGNLALFYVHQKRYAEAEALYLREFALYDKYGYNTSDVGIIGLSRESLARLYQQQSKNSQAAAQFLLTLNLYETKLLKTNPGFVAQQTTTISDALKELHQPIDVPATYQRMMSALPADSVDKVWFIAPLAQFEYDRGDLKRASALYQQELAILERCANQSYPHDRYTIQLANGLDQYAQLLERTDHIEDAARLSIRAFKLRNPNRAVPEGFYRNLKDKR